MTAPEEAQPVKRRPGRPRKVTPEAAVVDPPDAWRTSPGPFAGDDRIGDSVDNPAWTAITFDDNREYRVENGVIVERVR